MNVLEQMLNRCAKKKLKQRMIINEVDLKLKNVDNINERLKKAYIYALQLELEIKLGNL